jgi:hypothetical protein
MKAFIVTRALQRAALASLVAPALVAPVLVACGGSSTSESSGSSSGTSSGSSSGAAGGSGTSSGATSGSSAGASGTSATSGRSASGASAGSSTAGGSGASSGASASGSSGAQSGASGSTSGYTSGATSGSASGYSSGATAGSSSGASSDGGPPPGCSIKNPVSQGRCGTVSYELTGSASACNPNDAGNLSSSECMALCPTQTIPFNTGMVNLTTSHCSIGQSADASGPELACFYPCPAGRRPEGLSLDAQEGPDAPARFLAQMAYLEQASIGAFERLARELEAHGAPSHLQVASRCAARDEVRHARVMKRLAERAGGSVRRECVAPVTVRSLVEIAIENAVEGCVRETFGAAVAIVQSRDARDVGVRRAMQRIAKDEARHSQLAWAVAEWIDGQLDAAARRRVQRAREEAIAQLRRETGQLTEAAITERLGMPSAAQASAMLDTLGGSLWSRIAA